MSENVKIIKNGLLFDGKRNEFLKNSVIVIEDNKITKVGEMGDFPLQKGMEINAKGKVVMPGLIDSHLHLTISKMLPVGPRKESIQHISLTTLEAEKRLKRLLESGFTTVMDCGAFEHIDLALREAIENKLIPGPRLLCCGKAITITGGHADSYFMPPLCIPTPYSWGNVCDGVDEVMRGVREEIKAGVDWIKLTHAGGGSLERYAGPSQLTIDEMKAACQEAHKTGVKVCIHAQGIQSIKDSVVAGVDSIDHGYEMDEEAAEMLRKYEIVHKMTSLAKGKYRNVSETQDSIPDVVMRKRGAFPYEMKVKALQTSIKMGVKVIAGTDAEGDANGIINAMEPSHWVKAGVKPIDALKAMTSNSAELLGVNTGVLEEGKLADILIFDGNPLENIDLLYDKNCLKMVIKGGEIEVRR